MSNPSIVQSKSGEGANPPTTEVHTVAAQFASLTGAHSAIVSFGTLSDFAGVHTDCITTDTQGNSFALLDQENTNPSGGAASLLSFLATNIAGDSSAADTVTQGFADGGEVEDFLANFVLEVSNVAATPLIGHSGNTQNALAPGTNNVNSGTAITVSAGQLPALMVAIAMNTSVNGTPGTPTVGTGMTHLTDCWAYQSSPNLACVATQLITSAGAYQAIFNQPSSAAEDMACVAVILQGVAVGGPMAGSASAAATAAGALSTGISLAGAPSSVASAAGTLTGSSLGALSASPTALTAATGALSSRIVLGAASSATVSATARLTNPATVTLTAPLYTGVGGVLDPNGQWSAGAPTVGNIVYYDPTFITILPDAQIVSTSNNCVALAEFFNGSTWSQLVIVLTPLMVGYVDITTIANGALNTAGSVVGTAASLVSATAALTAAIQLAGNAPAVTSATTALTAAIRMAGAAIVSATAPGGLTTGIPLAGSISSTSSAVSTLAASISLTAAAVSVLAAAGNLATQITLAANALVSSSAIGSLQSNAALAGAPTAAAIASASLLTQIQLAGAASALTVATGPLNAQIQLLGLSSGSSNATGDLSVSKPVAGTASAVATAMASLQTLIDLSGYVWTRAAARGDLRTGIVLSADVLAGVSATGSFTTVPTISPPNSLADIRVVCVPRVNVGHPAVDVPLGSFYQPVEAQLWYGVDFAEWLANRWERNRDVSVGQTLRPCPSNGFQLTCVTAGHTGATEPDWVGALGVMTLDGSAVWLCSRLDDASLSATVLNVSWQASSDLTLSVGGTRSQMALLLLDSTRAVEGADYDVQCTAVLSDGESYVAKFRVRVR